MLARIKDAERDHMVAELQHRIAEMYIQVEMQCQLPGICSMQQ